MTTKYSNVYAEGDGAQIGGARDKPTSKIENIRSRINKLIECVREENSILASAMDGLVGPMNTQGGCADDCEGPQPSGKISLLEEDVMNLESAILRLSETCRRVNGL